MGSDPFKLDEGPLSLRGQKKAEIELRETPENVAKAVAELRRLIENDPGLYFRTDEELLKIYLRPTKYYPQSAYKMLKRTAEYRKDYPALFESVLPSVEKEAFLTTTVVNVLTGRDQDGRRMLVLNMGSNWNPNEMSTDTLFRVLYLIQTASSFEPETQVNGSIIIINLKGMGFKQVRSITPGFAYKLMVFIQEVMPARLKEIHVVFQTMVFNVAWQLFKPLLKEKLKKRVHFHGHNMKSLHAYLDPDYLPKDFGGNLPAINYSGANWYPVISSIEERIKEWNTFGFVEKA